MNDKTTAAARIDVPKAAPANGQTVKAAPVPITRAEAFRRICNTLKRLQDDEARRKVLVGVSALFDA